MNQDQYTQEEKQKLLKIARTTLEQYILEQKIYQPQSKNPKLLRKRGVFVTLHLNEQLKGCIGNIDPIKSLIEAVRDNAIAAAAQDPRFSPVTENELSQINIEISILTKPKRSTLEQIKPRVDGVILQQGTYLATFLPQVWEELANKEKFLSHLSAKAGLDSDAWSNPQTEFKTYQAIVFNEK